MSDGVQRAAGSQLRNILRSMTKNRFLGLFTGFFTTALVQSSSATTVMTVSFVNAGLLTLIESAGVMMGANVGTTITGWIVSILGFKINLSTYSIPLFAFGVPMLFSNRPRFRYWGEFLIGFAVLFLGINYLREAFPNLNGDPQVLDFLKTFTSWGFLSRIFFILVGAVVTIVVQSSSAAMTITLTMCTQGWLPLDVAAAMILGENIGTTITAEVASLVGNANARRSARIHSMFNLIGVTWMVILMPYFLPALTKVVDQIFGTSADITIYLSAFHTAFNLINVLLLIGFVNWLVRAAMWSIRSGREDDDATRLKFISTNTRTPELATVELQKETGHFGEVVSRMSRFARNLINSTDNKERHIMMTKLRKYEKIADDMEIEITEYITKLSNQEITPKTSLRLRSILNVCNDLERIGDIYYQISKTIEQKNANRIYFTPEQRNNINHMIDKIDVAFTVMVTNLQMPSYDKVSKIQAMVLRDELKALRNQFRQDSLESMQSETYNVRSAMIYNNVISALEKIGDHIVNVTEAIVGEI